MVRRMRIHKRVIVGGDPVTPGKEYHPGDEDDFEDGTAATLEEHELAVDASKEKETEKE